ncbi:tetratricopeptide repeat protein [Pelomonas sp. SE-A7]|uniref:tetratricopeptide repeat protein n=1 Tax=Pelomonas sp. SE-A7 TaxID=3054953 RepID=UPI00259D222A|nr:tetratricopeptide repeat protein [Pelomonas sp. SE-A7]MDM4765652.1 tetratricopeptide repeat protein [Pelomonas sp. SE-A7]
MVKNGRSLYVLASLSLALGTAQAQFKDPQLQAAADMGRPLELEKLAQSRLAAKADDAEAVVALGRAAMDLGDEKKIEQAVGRLEQCVGRQPPVALCHYMLGTLSGVQAMNASVFKMPGLAGKSRDNLKKAVELDPQLYEARESLLQYYLMAPGIVGGGADKAQALVADTDKFNPQYGRMLRARQAVQDKQWAVVERELGAVQVGQDKDLRTNLRRAWQQMGLAHLNAKQPEQARAVYERVRRDFPEHAAGSYGLARALTDLNKADEALTLLEQARALDGAASLPIDYRVGLAWIAKGDKPQAKAALQRFVADKNAHPRNVEEARKRLAELG